MKVIDVIAANDPNIDRTWQSHEGTRKIEAIYTKPDGTKLYGISTDGSRSHELVKPEDLEKQISREIANGISNKKFQDKQNAEQAVRDAEQKLKLSLDGFEDTLSAMPRARAIKALCLSSMRVNGKFYISRRDAIRDLIKNGYTVSSNSNGRIFTSNDPKRGFFVEKDFTKYGIDYAEYLIKRKVK